MLYIRVLTYVDTVVFQFQILCQRKIGRVAAVHANLKKSPPFPHGRPESFPLDAVPLNWRTVNEVRLFVFIEEVTKHWFICTCYYRVEAAQSLAPLGLRFKIS